MNSTDGSTNPVRQRDVAALIGILVTVEGSLMAGQLDERTTAKLADRFVNAGLLTHGPDGQVPTAGRLRIAMEDLVQRLRFAYGDYHAPPEPEGEAAMHVLAFPSESAARSCEAALAPEAQDLVVRPDATRGWQVYATYPELPPDPDFLDREQRLRQVAVRFGGTYTGSQGPLP